jgi:hypothetical protein
MEASILRLCRNLDFVFLDDARSQASLASPGTVALFTCGSLYVQDLCGGSVVKLAESGVTAAEHLPFPSGGSQNIKFDCSGLFVIQEQLRQVHKARLYVGLETKPLLQ